MTERIYSDRSRVQSYLRCRRQRYWEYHAGPQGRGITPVRKSLHLIIGLGVHRGLEVLLKASGEWYLDRDPSIRGPLGDRRIEQMAVDAALEEMAGLLAAGVEVDLQEQPEKKEQIETSNTLTNNIETASNLSLAAHAPSSQDSPIVIDFSDLEGITLGAGEEVRSKVVGSYTSAKIDQIIGAADFSQPIYPVDSSSDDSALREIELHAEANQQAATGVDDYLKLELAALVEAMVRAYARRRLKPLLDCYEIFEVEREGSWKLGEVRDPKVEEHMCTCGHPRWEHDNETGTMKMDEDGGSCLYCDCKEYRELPAPELWWMSRHDALLLERSTQQLYLLSYKTTGAWDRRKKQDAEIDMQGLSEAVDVEKRLGEAWELVTGQKKIIWKPRSVGISTYVAGEREDLTQKRIAELISPRIAEWLLTQPSPPRILGVRYEYILKGARRQDKKDPLQPGRYVQDSPLIRAYRSDGITAEDRRWAPSYEWFDATGKQRRIDYRSWRKAPVWETMPIAQWIDLLDAGDYWPGRGEDFDERGAAADVLGDQFVPPVVVWRSEDDLRDFIEQAEAQETQVALDVAAVRACGEDEGKKRSELNRRFQQNRQACVFPGLCSFIKICYGGEDIRRDPLSSGLYTIREANHPIENIAVDVN